MYTVYRITNTKNGKAYIGITSRPVEQRWEEHLSRARCEQRQSRLYDAIRKYGPESFIVTVIASSVSEDEIREMEGREIRRHDTYESGYNCNYGGCGILHFPEEIKKKISDAQKGKVISFDTRRKMSLAKTGDPRCAKQFGSYTNKGSQNPKAKWFLIQFPDGHTEVVCGLRAFCRTHDLLHCKMSANGKTKGFVLLKRFNDHPEREYAQASGSGAHPDSSRVKIWSALHGNMQRSETTGRD